MRPDDKLYPVITLTILWNADEWNAPKDLHSMLDADEETLRFIDNYHVHLITPADIAEGDFGKFHSELSLALRYIKHSKDKNRLVSMLKNDDAFTSVSRKTANLINTVTNSKLKYHDGEENVDMCKAMEDYTNELLAEGRAEGREEGRAEGREEGIAEGKKYNAVGTAKRMLKSGKFTLEEIAEYSELTLAEVRELADEFPC